MWVLHLGLGFHLRLPRSPMDYFKMNLHVGLHLGHGFHSKAPKLHICYFKLTLHVGIAFKVWSSLKVT
jgi:hypothetical protein